MLTSTFSVTDWWIAAIVSGIALALAVQSMVTTKRDKLKAVLLPLVGAACMVVSSAAKGYEGKTPLMLFTATMLGLALTRVIFAGYIRRQVDLVRSGKPMKELTGTQAVLFFLTFTAVVATMAVVL
ncbi:hypothetical protein [Streptomyces bluensis]|uniref:hypothetical protein n=1 Tax=Streptomyces bluensis TaxID=33897 RepID=UPI001062B569|nr:hypothetical protein [Streptomyces bluensis]GGZ72710.1 hypothetical protein GCM10010344_44740 [Streptomyces bluensis]